MPLSRRDCDGDSPAPESNISQDTLITSYFEQKGQVDSLRKVFHAQGAEANSPLRDKLLALFNHYHQTQPDIFNQAFIKAALAGDVDFIQYLFKVAAGKLNIDYQDADTGMSALMIAADINNQALVQALITAGANPFLLNTKEETHKSALYYAAWRQDGKERACWDNIDTMLHFDSTEVSQETLQSSYGLLLLAAAKDNQLDWVRQILPQHPTMLWTDKSGKHSLGYAIEHENREMLELLAAYYRFGHDFKIGDQFKVLDHHGKTLTATIVNIDFPRVFIHYDSEAQVAADEWIHLASLRLTHKLITETKVTSMTVGSKLVVLDSVDKEEDATVKEVSSDGKRIFIHYDKWSNKWDEWLDLDKHSARIISKPAPKEITLETLTKIGIKSNQSAVELALKQNKHQALIQCLNLNMVDSQTFNQIYQLAIDSKDIDLLKALLKCSPQYAANINVIHPALCQSSYLEFTTLLIEAGLKKPLINELVYISLQDTSPHTATEKPLLYYYLLEQHKDKLDFNYKKESTLLLMTIRNGLSGIAHSLIENGASIHLCDNADETCAHYAVKYQCPTLLHTIIKKDPSILIMKNQEGLTTLDLALQKKDLDSLHSILSALSVDRAPPDEVQDEAIDISKFNLDRLLFTACKEQNLSSLIGPLLSLNVNPNYICQETGKTALHLAVESHDYAVIEMLLHAKATSRGTAKVLFPVVIAANNKDWRAVMLFIESGVEPYTSFTHTLIEAIKDDATEIYIAIAKAKPELINAIYQGGTALHTACDLENVDAIQFLLSQHQGNFIQNQDQLTPLEIILNKARINWDIVQLFIEQGYHAKAGYGKALRAAIKAGREDIVVNLCQFHISRREIGKAFEFELILAVTHQSENTATILKSLLAGGYRRSLNKKNVHGQTALEILLNQEVIQWDLVQLFIKPDYLKDCGFELALIKAIEHNQTDIVRELIEIKVPLRKSALENSHLMIAIDHIEDNDLSLVKMLLEYNACITSKNVDGKRALELVLESSEVNWDLVELFIQRGYSADAGFDTLIAYVIEHGMLDKLEHYVNEGNLPLPPESLLIAIEHQHEKTHDIIAFLLEKGAEKRLPNKVKPTPLERLLNEDVIRWDLVKLFIDKKFAQNCGFEYALHWAITHNNLPFVKMLVHEANMTCAGHVDKQYYLATAINLYAQHSLEMIQFIMENGSDALIRIEKNQTALQLALTKLPTNWSLLSMLVHHYDYRQNRGFEDILKLALEHNQFELASYLLSEKKAELRQVEDIGSLLIAMVKLGGLGAVNLLLQHQDDFIATDSETMVAVLDKDGLSAMEYAIQQQETEIVHQLLLQSIQYLGDKDIIAALHFGVQQRDKEIIHFVLKHLQSLDKDISHYFIASETRPSILSVIIETFADNPFLIAHLCHACPKACQLAETESFKDETPVALAKRQRYHHVLEALSSPDKYAQPLPYILNFDSVNRDVIETLQFAISHDPFFDINQRFEHDKTALHKACEQSNWQLALLLIGQGIDVHARDREGNTALHKAVQQGNLDMVRYLVAFALRPDIPNEHGLTALQLAQRHPEMSLLLEQAIKEEFTIANQEGNHDEEMTTSIYRLKAAIYSGSLDLLKRELLRTTQLRPNIELLLLAVRLNQPSMVELLLSIEPTRLEEAYDLTIDHHHGEHGVATEFLNREMAEFLDKTKTLLIELDTVHLKKINQRSETTNAAKELLIETAQRRIESLQDYQNKGELYFWLAKCSKVASYRSSGSWGDWYNGHRTKTQITFIKLAAQHGHLLSKLILLDMEHYSKLSSFFSKTRAKEAFQTAALEIVEQARSPQEKAKLLRWLAKHSQTATFSKTGRYTNTSQRLDSLAKEQQSVEAPAQRITLTENLQALKTRRLLKEQRAYQYVEIPFLGLFNPRSYKPVFIVQSKTESQLKPVKQDELPTRTASPIESTPLLSADIEPSAPSIFDCYTLEEVINSRSPYLKQQYALALVLSRGCQKHTLPESLQGPYQDICNAQLVVEMVKASQCTYKTIPREQLSSFEFYLLQYSGKTVPTELSDIYQDVTQSLAKRFSTYRHQIDKMPSQLQRCFKATLNHYTLENVPPRYREAYKQHILSEYPHAKDVPYRLQEDYLAITDEMAVRTPFAQTLPKDKIHRTPIIAISQDDTALTMRDFC